VNFVRPSPSSYAAFCLEVQPMGILDEMKGVADAVHEVKNLELYERILNVRSDVVSILFPIAEKSRHKYR
jgi:hypothetical protein